MKILFLGTSAAWPLPRLGCFCRICTSSDPKDRRFRPSILVNEILQIDAGPDFYHQYQKFKEHYKNFKYLFISHKHADHTFGLHDLFPLKTKPKIYLPSESCYVLKKINEMSMSIVLGKACIFTLGQTIELNSLEITGFLVDHSTSTKTHGFLIKEKSKKIIYAPDFRNIPKSSFKFLRNADLAIFDGSCFFPAGPARFGHMAMRESIKLAKKLKIKQVYYTHIGHGPRMNTHKVLEEKVQELGGKNFHIAWDGLEIMI